MADPFLVIGYKRLAAGHPKFQGWSKLFPKGGIMRGQADFTGIFPIQRIIFLLAYFK